MIRCSFSARAGPLPRVAALPIALFAASLSGACGARGGTDAPTPDRPTRAGADAIEPLAEAVPAGAVADSGLFVVHRTDDKLLFQIPDSLLGRDMLLISRIARVPADMGGFIPAGYKAEEQVLRWERRNKQILLRKISFRRVADDSLPIATSVINNNFAPIVEAFDIEGGAEGEGAVLIDVTAFFEGDVPAISGLSRGQRQEFGVRRLDDDRSFINYARAYPLNVDVRHTLTFEATEPPSDENTGTISLEMHQSMVLLPAAPMRPRLADPRVGWFTVRQIDFGLPEQKAAEREYIRRWRLEPSDPAAYAEGRLVDPVQPIEYYLDPATPTEWRPCVRSGIEDWQVAFETAGFSNAIIARDAPSAAEDPEWSGEDVRYSVVRWAASTTRNAQGPSVSDPRTGEILESDIVWYHNHMRSYRNRLMLETGAANPLARSLPIDRGLMCEAMRQVIAHEVGHALGLPHNMIASSAYPVDSLRVPEFARRMGVAPTIMDYARQNYIAQPGDGLEGADFLRQIGPYDHYAINWGYRVVPDAGSADAEKPTLDGWILEHEGDPIYRYAPQRGGLLVDPAAQTEDLGDDPVRASAYGIANLQRVAPNLVAWTSTPGRDYEDLSELYGELIGQWFRYVNHVLAVVGGVHEVLKASDQAGVVYEPLPRERQEEAIAFLGDQVFEAPTWLNDPNLLARIEHAGGVQRISGLQEAVLGRLLDAQRLQRLVEIEALGTPAPYPLAAFLEDVAAEVWANARSGAAQDVYRRQLQRGHLSILEALMTEDASLPPSSPFLWRTPVDLEASEVRPLVRAQLLRLQADARRGAGAARDAVTRAHLRDVVARVDAIFERARTGS